MLWSTQAFSSLDSGMTGYALVLWLYLRSGSALKTIRIKDRAFIRLFSFSPFL